MQTTRPTPRTLQAEAEQHANDRHTARLAELHELAPLLAQLDTLRQPLAAAGLTLYPDALSLTRVRRDPGNWNSPRLKVLRIGGCFSVHSSQRPAWHTALVDLGFRTLSHNAGSVYPTAIMRKGTLLLEVDLSAAESAALAAAAQPQAEVA